MRGRNQKLFVLGSACVALGIILFGKQILLLHPWIRDDVVMGKNEISVRPSVNRGLNNSVAFPKSNNSSAIEHSRHYSETNSRPTLSTTTLSTTVSTTLSTTTTLPPVPTPSLEERFYRLRPTRINSLKYKVISSHEQLCDTWGNSSHPRILILVLSNPANKAERTAIRNTWASNRTPYNSTSVKVLFIVGDNADHVLRDELSQENQEYRDMLQADFPDSYQSISTKVLIALHWASHFCSNADFFFKTDDDIFVNVPTLVTTLNQFNRTNTIFGVDIGFAPVKRTGKWQLSPEEFPFDRFPLYLSGCGYGMSVDAAKRLVKTSEYVPQIPLEDVYITGILPRIANVSVVTSHAFPTWMSQTPSDACLVLKGRMVALHGVKIKRMYDTWELAKDGTVCVPD